MASTDKQKRWKRLGLGLGLMAALAGGLPAGAQTRDPVSVLDLQPFRRQEIVPFPQPGGGPGSLELVNLNPKVNVWYLLAFHPSDGGAPAVYHLENAEPDRWTLELDKGRPGSLVIRGANGPVHCDLWSPGSTSILEQAAATKLAFAPICGDRVYLRNPTRGHRTAIETVTDFLRDNIPGGESVVGFVRDTFFKASFRKDAQTLGPQNAHRLTAAPGWPEPALAAEGEVGRWITPTDLGIPIETHGAKGVQPGGWYAAQGNPGIFVSLIQPSALPAAVLDSHRSWVSRLEPRELSALVYLVAFDLDRFDLGFAVGTDHPRVDWSSRVPEGSRDNRLPGPDGIGTLAPLRATGLINPAFAGSTAATFTGGFKRAHGAFKYGRLSTINHGSHYGFVESGVVLSRLQPGLATLFATVDGFVDMKTWQSEDDGRLDTVRHARQNGVAIIETDPDTGQGVPGMLVSRWGAGNWSGSKDAKLRTLRAAVALQEGPGGRFLIYGYFSSATPSAMARVFQAYQCRYAMHMDMNALEHTYLAVYRKDGESLLVQHLIQEMNVLDKTDQDQYVPRFLGYSDNRDFFYLMRR